MSLFQALPKTYLNYGQKQLDLSTPKIMGVLNVTPDSFSDGGRFNTIDTALAHTAKMIDEGASIIDIGAESNRPNANKISDDDELARLYPIVRAIRQAFPKCWLSIDTSSPVVMAAMAELGADMWNDVRGLKRAGAAKMASRLGVPVVIMHALGEPDTMDSLAEYTNVVADVRQQLLSLVNNAISQGVAERNIIIDVGMGFAKNYQHHVAILRQLTAFNLGYPMLFGVSRKRFLGEVLQKYTKKSNHKPIDRDGIGAAAAIFAVQQGASIIRTHNVGATADGLALWQALAENG